MAVEILMPKLGLTMKTGTVIKWLKESGDTIVSGEPLVEIETEKLSHQIEAPSAGVLLQKSAEVGLKYPVSAVLGYIGQAGEALPEMPNTQRSADNAAESAVPSAISGSAKPAGSRVCISPVAKKLASELRLDYSQVAGTGPTGRIVKADILRHSETLKSTSTKRTADAEPDVVLPYSGMRRAIGENMQLAWTTIPMVTHHVSADAGELLEFREKLNIGITDKNEKISINDLLLKLTAVALSRLPIINSELTENGIVLYKSVHLGMATSVPNGLIVPVIRDADRKGLPDISREARSLARRARQGELRLSEIEGATFTVSNLGGYGSVDFFTPIINPPQAAILGVGRIKEQAVPINGEIAVRPMIGLSFTYDHRIIDGATAAEFIASLMKLLENPARASLL